MPVYNGLPLIKASIESLMRQTLTEWECVIVDDGSSDGTAQWLDTLTDVRIVVHHFPHNQGRPAARQKALEMAKGEYIAMLDAGDLYHPDKLNLQVNAFLSHPEVALVGAGMTSFGINTDILVVRGKGDCNVKEYDGHTIPCHGPSMLRNSLAKKLKYNPLLKMGEDLDFLSRYLVGQKYLVLDKALYFYSELDSVNKSKVLKTYKYQIRASREVHKYLDTLKISAKYLIRLFTFPFLSSEAVLKQRGNPANQEETSDYEKFCKPLIRKVVDDGTNE